MFRTLVVVLLFALPAAVTFAQVDPSKLPTVATGGNTNPGAISDINAQLIWLLAATVPPGQLSGEESMDDRIAASLMIRVGTLGTLNPEQGKKLESRLSQFRSAHDALAADYNARISSVAREDVWMEYRDFRVKVNDLVADTIRTLNNDFPDSASSLRSAIQRVRDNVFVSTYKSSTDPDYANSPRTAATGFAYIQGAVANSAYDPEGKTVHYITAVVTGMVPGCPGKPYPTATIDGAIVEGPKLSPLQYMNFQRTRKSTSERPSYFIAVKCAIPSEQ